MRGSWKSRPCRSLARVGRRSNAGLCPGRRGWAPVGFQLVLFPSAGGDEHDLTTRDGARAAVLEASGPAASWRDIDGIMALWNDPTTDRAYWERVWTNRLVKSSSQAFDVERWKSLAKPHTVQSGALITLGFDGAMFHDATAIVATEIETGYQWVAGLWECPSGRTDWQTPAGEVDATVRDLFDRFDVWRMYCDPPYWQSWIAAWSGAFGKDRVVEWFSNRRRAMTAALEGFHTALREGTICHDGDKDLTRHIGNSKRQDFSQRDEQGKAQWLIRKERPDSPHKIDLAMAAILSWECRNDAVAAGVKTESVYETRGILILGGDDDVSNEEIRMREQAIDGVRTGSMGVAKDGYDALQALKTATHCTRCSTPKQQFADWRASINRTRARGSVSSAESSCSAVDARAATMPGAECRSPVDRRARLAHAERLTGELAPQRRGTTSMAARLARLEQAERKRCRVATSRTITIFISEREDSQPCLRKKTSMSRSITRQRVRFVTTEFSG